MNWWQKLRSQRRIGVFLLGLILLVAAILFADELQNLFTRPASQAAISDEDLGRIWEANRPDGGDRVAHSKLAIVETAESGTTRRWLYAIGGLRVEQNVIESRYQAFVSKEVRRLELDTTNNAQAGTSWEVMPDLNFGHMEFGLVQNGDYLYVVAGDMNQPPDKSNNTPLLYSTIERLNLNSPTSWEVYSLLSGVNYYPEVLSDTNTIHVVGGVYGNPFPAPPMPDLEGVATPIDPGQFMSDLLNSGESETKWQALNLANKKVIGPPLYLPKGTLNAPVQTGNAEQGPTQGGTGDSGGSLEHGGTGGSTQGDFDVSIQQAESSIRVIRPNGGEVKYVGKPTLIEWEITPNVAELVNVWWQPNTFSEWEYLGQVLSTTNFRHLEWTPSLAGQTARVQVCIVDGPTDDGEMCDSDFVGDESDATFEVRQPTSIFITDPAEGATVTGGQPYTIRWFGGDVHTKLEYSLDGWRWYHIGSAPASAGSFVWNVPDIAATGARLRITDIISGATDTQTITIAGGTFVSAKLTEALLSGNFVTTVGEHFLVNTTNANSSIYRELGSDYLGSSFSSTWQKGRVSAWGHLRFLVTDETVPQIVPVPQGRYGHRLIQYGSAMHVFGGATWSNEVVVGDEALQTFWVIDDAKHVAHRYNDPKFTFRFGSPAYEFVGNITYRYNAARSEWEGTNRTEGPNTRNAATFQLDSRFTFNSDFTETVGRGRAFYSLSTLDNLDLLAVGGLINNISSGTHESLVRNISPCGSGIPCRLDVFRATVRPTSSTRQLTTTSGWTKEQAYFEDVYNLYGHGIRGGAIVYAGQTQFNYPTTDAQAVIHNPHVPDYNFPASIKTSAFSSQTDVTTQRWLPMADLTSNIPASQRRLSYLEIDPPIFTIVPGDSRTFTVGAFDQNGGPLGSNVTYNWQLENNNDSGTTLIASGRTATLTAGSLFQTIRIRVNATYSPPNGSPQVVTERSVVSIRSELPQSELSLVRLRPKSIQTVINGKRQFEAITYDQFGSQIGVPSGFVWTADSTVGTIISQQGRTAIFQAVSSINGDITIQDAVTVRVNNQFADSADVTVKETALGESAVFGADVLATTRSAEFSSVSSIFHYGGFHLESGEFSDVLLSLGYFGELGNGRPQTTITLLPDQIAPDDATFSLATVKITDRLGNPLSRSDNGDRLAVSLITSRSATDLITDDGSYSGSNPERAEILGEVVPGSEANGQYAFVDDDSNSDNDPLTGPGEAKFRVYAKTASDPNGIDVIMPGILIFGNESLGMADTGATAKLKIGNFPGVPVAGQSRIIAVPAQVPADNTTVSNVTVELRDYLGNPVNDYYVRLLSDRNLGGNATDTITPAETQVAGGVATFTVKSAIKGLTTLRIAVAKNLSDLGSDPTLPNFAKVRFTGSITSLVPSSAKQGQGPFTLTATGNNAGWTSGPGPTVVRFVAPTTTTFISGISNQPLTDDEVILPADGFSLHNFGLSAPEFAGRGITFSVKSGSGSIFGSTTGTLGSDGRAFFTYEAGSATGLTKLEARIDNGPTSELWLMLTDPRPHPYEFNLFASPASLSSGTSQLRTGIYRYTSQGKKLQNGQEGQDDAAVSLTYFTDDQPNNGSVTPVINPTDSGLGTATYSAGNRNGPVRLFATGTYRGYFIATATVIDKLSPADANISFNESGITISGSATGNQTMTIPGTAVASQAIIGIWRFKTETPTPEGDTEIITHPFTVVPANAVTGPRLTSLQPAEVNRGANNIEILLTGADTNFFGTDSVVTLTPTGTGASASGITIVNTTVLSPTSVRIRVNVAENAYAGFWNAKIETNNGAAGIEVAELAGETDLLVTTASNYIVDLVATPHRIPRDGRARSQITAFVGRLDPVNGQITPIANQPISFGFVGSDGGSLNPATATTSSTGVATTTYTTDAGTESEEVYIRGTVTISGTVATGTALIIKEVDSSHRFGLTANPTLLPLSGGTSALEANVYDRSGTPVAANTPVEFLIAGPGSVNPTISNTNSAGRANSQFQIGSQLSPKVARVVAKATIPGLGTVFSNDALISIGADDSDYRVIITANPPTLEAGSGDSSLITATLTYTGNGNPTPVANWPMTFSLSLDQPGDYLTVLSGTTNASGQITSRLVAGSFAAGPIVVTSHAVGLTIGQVVVTKTADPTVNPQLSTLSAVPKYVPADGTAFSLLTVTARNRNFVPLAGKAVTISSSLGVITPSLTGTTNAMGQAIFQIRSNTVGTGQVTATVDGVTLTTRVFFEPVGSLLAVSLDTIVPLEAKNYDRHIKLYLRQTGSTADPVIDELYYTNSADQIMGLPTIYLSATANYTYWAKSKFHLARTKPVATTTAGTVAVNFNGVHRGQTKGLLIGDLAPDRSGTLANPFKDNAINAVDVVVIIGSWFRYSYPADFNSDLLVNSLDFTYWTVNYGSGSPLP